MKHEKDNFLSNSKQVKELVILERTGMYIDFRRICGI